MEEVEKVCSFSPSEEEVCIDEEVYELEVEGNNIETEVAAGNLMDEPSSPPPKKSREGGKYKAGITRPGETRCLEPGCTFKCNRIPQLRAHLAQHGFLHEATNHSFPNEKSFNEWLSTVESEGRCTFMRRRGWQQNKNGSKTACFYCHRGGAYTSKASKKRTKIQGTCKTGVECTSSMKAVFWPKQTNEDGTETQLVEVEAYLQHYGHNTDIEHTRLSKIEKHHIAQRLSLGVSRNKVLDEIRETLDWTDSPNRLHLISIQDIYNIEKNNRKKGGESGDNNKNDADDEDGATTVQAWIEKMQTTEDNPVLLIKYQQEKPTLACSCLSSDDFILVMQTSLQAKLLQRHGNGNIVCLDITQGGTDSSSAAPKNDFYLCTLEVLVPNPCNDVKDVYPVAWFVCNRKDKNVITIFLQQIKANMAEHDHNAPISPSHLMVPTTGLTSSCNWYHIWQSVFCTAPVMLYASWHVCNDWRRQINMSKIRVRNEDVQVLMSNMMLCLQQRDVEQFDRLQSDFVQDVQNNPLTSDLALFVRTLFKQPSRWAFSWRDEMEIEADQRFEEFNLTLSKTIYSEGFKRKQLDVLIKTLLKYSRDKTLGKLRNTYKQNNHELVTLQTSRQHEISENRTTVGIEVNDTHTVWKIWQMKWVKVISSQNEDDDQPQQQQADASNMRSVFVTHTIEYQHGKERCMARLNCNYRCPICSVCPHELKCSCDFYQTTGVLCEHCHLVCRHEREHGRDMVAAVTAAAAAATNPTSTTDDNNAVTATAVEAVIESGGDEVEEVAEEEEEEEGYEDEELDEGEDDGECGDSNNNQIVIYVTTENQQYEQ